MLFRSGSAQALSIVRSGLSKEIGGYDLIDAIASYYVCLEKPETIFHRFPQWVFVFRNRRTRALLTTRISDSRIPRIPVEHLEAVVRDTKAALKPGWIAYLSIVNRPEPSLSLKLFDELGRMQVKLSWEVSDADRKPFPEVMETDRKSVV